MPPGSPPGSPEPPGPPGGSPWAGPSGWSPQPPKNTDGVAIAALVLGIIALLASIIPFGLFIGVPLGIAAIVCGIIGLRRSIQRGLAIAGLVTGVLALLVAVAYVVLFAWFVESGQGFLDSNPGFFDDIQGAFAEGDLTTDSTCAGGADVATFAGPLAEGAAVTVHQVQACPDFAEDVQFGVEVENPSDEPVNISVTVTGMAGTEAVTDPMSTDVTLQPGDRGWLQIVTFDEWRTPDEVDVEVATF